MQYFRFFKEQAAVFDAGRELRILDFKREVNEPLKQMKQPLRCSSA